MAKSETKAVPLDGVMLVPVCPRCSLAGVPGGFRAVLAYAGKALAENQRSPGPRGPRT